MKLRKTVCLMLAAVFLFLCSCTNTASSSDTPSESGTQTVIPTTKEFSLLYYVGDSINPYKAETLINRQLSTLLFDPLVRLDDKFQPEYVLAESIETNGKDCVITIKSAYFSDGSEVTAQDVVYSYNLAKKSTTSYASQLAEITSFKADGDKEISVTLSKADPYFANLLDFPVIKSGSDNLTDQNKIELPPIGSGRYVPDFSNLKLIANASHILGDPSVAVINLINTPDSDVAKYNLETGNVSIFSTDMSDGVIPPMSGSVSTVSLNRLVYLGLNLENGILSNEKMRYALSSAVDRALICENAYYSYATPATGIFNPLWEDAKGLQNISSSADMQNLVAYLEEIGYNSKDEEGFLVNSNGKRLKFSLVYYEGNSRRAAASELITEQLKAVGIEIEAKALAWNEYVSSLQNGWFDMYIAEVKLLNNMDISELVTPGGSLAYGIPKPSQPDDSTERAETETQTEEDAETDIETDTNAPEAEQIFSTALAVKGFYGEKLSLIDIINAFNAEMPIIPICYTLGVTVCDPSQGINNVSSVTDAYFGI